MGDDHDNVMIPRNIVIRIDFPALDNLVTYLKDNAQEKIDAITAQLNSQIQGLQQHRAGLDQAIADQEKT